MNENNIQRNFLGKTVKFVFNYANNHWYISLLDILSVLANPSQPSSYWGHLRNKYFKEGIDIAEKVRLIDMLAPNGKCHLQKAITLNNAIQLIKLLNMEQSSEFVDWIREESIDLSRIKNDLLFKKVIMNYLESGINSIAIKEKLNIYLNQVIIRNK